MKKNSVKMKLLSAAGMLAISAAMLATSTYAWFSMNKEVSVTGLQTKAVAEDGILIGAYTGTTHATAPTAFAVSATATEHDSVVELKPTFTNDGTTWYHAASKQVDNGQDYTDDGYTNVTTGAENEYYLYDKFKIKSTGGAAKDIYVKNIEVTSGGAQDYDSSIRVLITDGTKSLIFNKTGTTWTSETAAASVATSDDITSDVTATATVTNTAGAKILEGVDTTGKDVSIYVYYDGEDTNCKTSKIVDPFVATTITVTFTSEEPT